MFTIRLEASDRPALRTHFLALGAEDRRLRFGFTARDSTIERYVKDIDFTRDAVFGVRNALDEGRQFDGITHLALDKNHAEIGVSVLEDARGRGIGSALVSRAAMHARNRGIEVLYMQCLSENRAIMRIAARARHESGHHRQRTAKLAWHCRPPAPPALRGKPQQNKSHYAMRRCATRMRRTWQGVRRWHLRSMSCRPTAIARQPKYRLKTNTYKQMARLEQNRVQPRRGH